MESIMTFSRTDFNAAWDGLVIERESIEADGRFVDDVQYHANQLINGWVAALFGHSPQPSWKSCYYQIDKEINGLPVTVRVSDHRGYSDSSYKYAHGRTGMPEFDKSIQSEPPRYIVSIEVMRDRYRRPCVEVETNSEDNITRIQLVNVNSESVLDQVICDLEFELNELL